MLQISPGNAHNGTRRQRFLVLDERRVPCADEVKLTMSLRGNSTRRSFLRTATAMGAVAAWGRAAERPPAKWKERRAIFPEGVASGDPDHHSVILWTRVTDPAVDKLYVEVAEDERFTKIVSNAATPVSGEADWTTRVLVGGLEAGACLLVSVPDEGMAQEAGLAARLRRPIPAIHAPYGLCSSVAKTRIRARRMHIGG